MKGYTWIEFVLDCVDDLLVYGFMSPHLERTSKAFTFISHLYKFKIYIVYYSWNKFYLVKFTLFDNQNWINNKKAIYLWAGILLLRRTIPPSLPPLHQKKTIWFGSELRMSIWTRLTILFPNPYCTVHPSPNRVLELLVSSDWATQHRKHKLKHRQNTQRNTVNT